MIDPDNEAAATQPSRRTLVRAGAAGTALWVTPVVFGLSATSADAASDGGGGEDPDPPDEPGEVLPPTCVPSNGLLFFQTVAGGVYYGVKIDSSGAVGRIPVSSQFDVPDPAEWVRWAGAQIEGGFTFDDEGTADGLFLTLPAGALMDTAIAYVADGNPTGVVGGGTPGHDFVEVTSMTVVYSYTKVC